MWELLGRHSDLVFILVWTALNLFQIATTELTSDEGYYWFYSTRLEWGYYDHPPFLAVLISLGTSLFTGEFGVRLFNVLLMSGGIFVLLQMMSPQERRFAYLLFFSIPLLNYITFIAFPDTPLVALSAFALYGYRRLLKENDLAAVLILGGSWLAAGGELPARRRDVAAAGEPHGGPDTPLLEGGPEGGDRVAA